MLVAVEATRFVRDGRGIGRYVRALLPQLTAVRADVSVTLHVRGDAHVAAARDWLASAGLSTERYSVLPIEALRNSNADVFWYPWNYPEPLPRRGTVVVTIHDVAPLAMPDPRWSAIFRNLLWRRRYARAASHASIVLADSEFTASEVRRLLAVPGDRIRIALLGADDIVNGDRTGDEKSLDRLGIEKPYVLTVGSADRRKDLATAVRAVERLVEAGQRITLVQAGNRWRRGGAGAEAAWLKPVGFVGPAELAALYRNAAALIVPSLYEGFGLPVLEAMTFGTPVVCARSASLPEVGGDAAAYFAAGNDRELADVVSKLLADPGAAADMRERGLQRAKKFTWNQTATHTLEAFDAAIASAAGR
ncbi:MAG: glycosyltransferase family 1 protein [Gemmatimonadetes bacterium]|nr:glycosyltransferase family 1 protein [Gemmatimonadota bacterium]